MVQNLATGPRGGDEIARRVASILLLACDEYVPITAISRTAGLIMTSLEHFFSSILFLVSVSINIFLMHIIRRALLDSSILYINRPKLWYRIP